MPLPYSVVSIYVVCCNGIVWLSPEMGRLELRRNSGALV
jgi:hypothetical protein